MKWYRGDQEITDKDKRYKITCDECKYTMVISDCTLEDTDSQFTLKCDNVSTTAKLTVEGRKDV